MGGGGVGGQSAQQVPPLLTKQRANLIFCPVKASSRGTLCIYGFMRENGLESQAPLARLLVVEKGRSETKLTFVNEGPDCAQWLPVSDAVWREKRQEASNVLVELGLANRISHHKANWVLKGGPCSRLVLIDVGNSSLDVKRTLKISQKRRKAVLVAVE